jgi:hypothetical protein
MGLLIPAPTLDEEVKMGVLGYRHTEEAKRKISESKLGKKRSPLSEERKKSISEFMKGNKYGKALKGIKRSEETKQKMSDSKKGANNPNFGKCFSKEHRNNMRKARLKQDRSELDKQHSIKMSGEGNPNWRGGITPEYHKIRNSEKYKKWRNAVYERDNYTCQICGSKKSNTFNAHHIKPFSLYPQLRFDINNGITLCKECHKNNGFHKNIYKQKAG